MKNVMLDRAAFWAAMLGLFWAGMTLPLGAVTETAVEFQAVGDVNGDDRADVVVVDKQSGMVRVGLGVVDSPHEWLDEVFSGVEQPTGIALGRVTATDRLALVVVSPLSNRVQVLEWTGDAVLRPLTVPTLGVGPASVAALEIGGVEANPALDDLAVATVMSGAAAPNQLDLVRSLGGDGFAAISESVTPTADDLMTQLRAFRLSRNPAVKPMLAMLRQSAGGTRFTLSEVSGGEVALDVPTASRTGIPIGSRYVSGFFGTEGNVRLWPQVMFYTQNFSQTQVHGLEFGGDPSVWFFPAVAPQFINYPNSVKSITVLPRANPLPDRLLVLFATGPIRAGIYDYDGVNFPSLVRALTVPVEGGDFSGALALADGGFVMLTGDTFGRTTGSHVYNAEGELVPKSGAEVRLAQVFASRANLLFYNMDPAVSNAPKLLGSYSTGDWTSELELGATASVTRERFAGGALGLRTPEQVDAGAPPAGTVAGLTNQNALPAAFKNAVSYFNLGGARGREVMDAEIDPPPGSYTRAVQVRLLPAADTVVKYRVRQGFFGPAQDWRTWTAGTVLDFYQTSTVEYYAQEGGLRGAVRQANYELSGIPNQDSDEDGVPDPFELEVGLDPNGGLDSDGDGVSDLVELLMGTDPNRADDFPTGFQAVAGVRNGETFQMQVTAKAVNGRSAVEDLNWAVVGTQITAADYLGNGTTASVVTPSPRPVGMPSDSGVAVMNEIPGKSRFPWVLLSTQPTFSVTNKSLREVRVIDGGSGYALPPTAILTPLVAGGVGAEVETVLEEGRVSEVRVVKTGADFESGGTVTFSPVSPGSPAVGSFLVEPGPVGRELLGLAPEPPLERVELNYFFPGGDVQAGLNDWLTQARTAYGMVSVPIVGTAFVATDDGLRLRVTTAVPHGLSEGDGLVIREMVNVGSSNPSGSNGAHLVTVRVNDTQFLVMPSLVQEGEGGFLIKAKNYGPKASATAELTHVSTLHALLVEDALASRLGMEDLTLFPGREGDEERRGLTEEDLERLERPGADTGAFLLSHIYEVLLEGLTDPERPASVVALEKWVRLIYVASSRRDTPTDGEADEQALADFVVGDANGLPAAYVNPVEVIRHLLVENEVLAPYDQDPALADADVPQALAGLVYLRGLIEPRALVEVELEVPLSGFFADCTILRVVGGFEEYALVAGDGRPYSLGQGFSVVPGMRFLARGYLDVPMACWQQNTMEVVSLEITDYPERVFDNSSPLGQSLVFAPPGRRYLAEGALDLSLHASSSSGLPVAFEVVSGRAMLAGSTLTFNGTGTVRVRASQAGDAQYRAARDVFRDVVVLGDPAANKLTLTGLSQMYDGTPRVVGVLNAPGAVTVEYRVGGVFVAVPPVLPGTYPVRALSGGLTRTGTLVVAKAPLFVTADDKRKFAGKPNPVLTLSYGGFVLDDKPTNSLTRAPVVGTSAKETSPGGEYAITVRGGLSAKYQLIYQRGTLVVESFSGKYEALLRLGKAGGFAPVGKLEVTVASSGRSFTARVALANESRAMSVRGALETNASGEIGIGMGQQELSGRDYDLTFQMEFDGPMSAGLFRDDVELAGAANGRRLLTLGQRETVPYAGVHTVVVMPIEGVGRPAGAGWAGATINSKGVLSLVGRLGDGTTFSSTLAADDQADPGYRLFVQPYRPARTDSYVAADFVLKPHPDLADRRYLDFRDQSELAWVKAGLPQDAGYRSGIPLASTSFSLDPWLPPAKATKQTTAVPLSERLGLVGPSFLVNPLFSAFASESYDDLPTVVRLNDLTNRFGVVEPVTNPTAWKLTVAPRTGTFAGEFNVFDDGARRRVRFTGALRQPASTDPDDTLGDGVFLLPPQAGSGNSEQTSGEIRLDRNP